MLPREPILETELRRVLAKTSKDFFLPGKIPVPLPSDHPISEIKNLFVSNLLKIPIFKKGSMKGDPNLYLQGDEYGQKVMLRNTVIELPAKYGNGPLQQKTITINEGEVLLDRLAYTLIFHFKSILDDSETIKYERTETFISSLKNLIASNILDEKAGKKIVQLVIRNLEKSRHNLFPSSQGTQLVKDLYNDFMILAPNIRKNTALQCIAHILKYFGTEKGSQKQIYERIRRNLYRKIPTIQKTSTPIK